MSEHTGIEWCDHTFNVAWGCMKVSPGCAHCYADTWASRYGKKLWGPASTTERETRSDAYWREPLKWNRAAEKEGQRARVFCSSMADAFEDHPTIIAQLSRLFALIRATPWLDWLILTKRPERIPESLPPDWGDGYPNVWLGTSVESQEYIGRVFALQEVPARVRFLSAEPLLGPVRLWEESYRDGRRRRAIDGLHWVIAGGESGPGARPCELDWLRGLRDDCAPVMDEGGIPFFLKQLGGFPDKRGHEKATLDGQRFVEWPSPEVPRE